MVNNMNNPTEKTKIPKPKSSKLVNSYTQAAQSASTKRSYSVRARRSHVSAKLPLWQCWPYLWIWRQPAMRQQFADLTVLVRGQTSQHILQIGIRVMPIEFGTLNQTHHCRRTLSRT
jgi:hypothetical protein